MHHRWSFTRSAMGVSSLPLSANPTDGEMQDAVPHITIVCAQCTGNPQSRCTGVILDDVFFSTNDLFPRSNRSRSAAVLAVVKEPNKWLTICLVHTRALFSSQLGVSAPPRSTSAAFLGTPREHSWTLRPCTWPPFPFLLDLEMGLPSFGQAPRLPR